MDAPQSLVTKAPFDAFYKENAGLVHKVSRKVHARLIAMGAAVEFEDVHQEAAIVMMRAYEKFDPSLGFQFSTYYMKAAFYDLNKFVKSYEQDRNVLGVFSMQAAVNDDGEEVNMEATIDGNHGSPEELLECKQLLEQIQSRLSPLASKLLEVMLDPPAEIEREWQLARTLGTTRFAEMPASFLTDLIARLPGMTMMDARNAIAEIRTLGRSMNV